MRGDIMCVRECPFGKVPLVEIVNEKCEIGNGCECCFGYPDFKLKEVEQMFRENSEKFERQVLRW